MKLESDHWKLEAVDDGEELFWPTSPTRYYTIQRPSTSSLVQVVHHLEKSSSPIGLQQLALEAYFSQLKNLCLQKNYEENKRSLKHYLKFQLPSALRQLLLDMSTKENRIYTLVDLNMFELLLSTTVKHVSVHQVRSFFRQQFVTSMRQLGTGLEQLAIHDSSWLDQRDILPAALARMTHLRKISLHYLANDMMIAALAGNCLHLQEMDVSYSIDVTDAAMRLLCDPGLLIDTKPEQPQRADGYRRRKISAPTPPTSGHVTSGCMVYYCWLPRLFRRHKSVVDGKQVDIIPLRHRNDEESATDNSSGQPQSCIRSLRRLLLLGTSVTSGGIQLVTSASPSITVVS